MIEHSVTNQLPISESSLFAAAGVWRGLPCASIYGAETVVIMVHNNSQVTFYSRESGKSPKQSGCACIRIGGKEGELDCHYYDV